MDIKTFGQGLREKFAAKMQLTKEALAIMWLGKRMDFFRSLTDGKIKVTMSEFSEVLLKLIGNPMFSTVTEEEKLLIETAILGRTDLVHHKTLYAYLENTHNFVVGEFFINAALSLEPAFEEEIIFGDPRGETVGLAFAAVSALAPDEKQGFAKLLQEMFPCLPTGANGQGGLRDLIDIVANPQIVSVRQAVLSKTDLLTQSEQGLARVARKSSPQEKTKEKSKMPRKPHQGIPRDKYWDDRETISISLNDVAPVAKGFHPDPALNVPKEKSPIQTTMAGAFAEFAAKNGGNGNQSVQ